MGQKTSTRGLLAIPALAGRHMVAAFPLPMVRRAIAENQHGSPRVAVFFSRLCGSYLCCCVKAAQPGPRCSGRGISSFLRSRLEA